MNSKAFAGMAIAAAVAAWFAVPLPALAAHHHALRHHAKTTHHRATPHGMTKPQSRGSLGAPGVTPPRPPLSVAPAVQ